MKLRILDLFSGIGGISLGLERTGGFETVAFCEVDEPARKVLQKHWPSVPIFNDVKTLSAKDIDGAIDVICGGFPCQDISLAGKGAGLEGERSGLWWEFHRLIKEIKPKWVIAENVSALRSRGLDQVLRSLSEIGYDAEWHCIPASAVGAPHRRDRIWIVAYPRHSSWRNPIGSRVAVDCGRQLEETVREPKATTPTGPSKAHEALAYSDNAGSQGWPETVLSERSFAAGYSRASAWWKIEPELGRVADGIPRRTHRLKQLGNAVVPQIPELIGRAILETNL